MSIDAEVKAALRRLDSKIKSRAFRGSNILLDAEKNVLGGKGGARTGRRYTKTNMKARYTASAPGEPPAKRTGVLRTGWKESNEYSGSLESGDLSVDIKIETIDAAYYDTYLEHGTYKMAARPHHDRIRKKAIPKIEQLFSDL